MAACPQCGVENRSGARFCDACGLLLTAPVDQHEKRKTVTVLFCDVVGSTALGESMDPEALRVLLTRYFERMKSIIERHGGIVEKFIGDAVMAVFGVPAAHEDDAVRALRAAVEMRDALPELGLEARIGINTGEVMTGADEWLATGDATNVAARLQQAATPGEILVGQETLALARDAVTVEALPPFDLKGKQQPVAAFRLSAVERGASGVARRVDAPMVGRADERRLLEDAFANAVRRRGCTLFTLLGAAGVGKSRLTREFLAGVDASVVAGRCLSYGEGITYWPVVEVVKQLGGDGTAADPIGVLLGESDVATTPEEIAWAVRKLVEGAAHERPLVVVFDDIHWGEPAFLDLIEHIVDLSREAPILLLCLARPELLERRPGWGGGKLNATTVLLEPLDGSETDELIERLLAGEKLEPGLAVRIRDAAEGNPLFVEEMLAMVRESGEREVVVPPTIKALLAARLDQLEPDERAVLERGSVEGQVFHGDAVAALASPPAPAVRQLVALVRKELLRPARSLLPGDAYRFRHLLIRDAAYDALPKALRAELHEKFAAWLEERGAELVELDEIFGYHLEQSHRFRTELGASDDAIRALGERAATRLGAAGRRALDRGDMDGASNLLERAATLLEEDDTARVEIEVELGEALLESGRLTKAESLLENTVARATRTSDRLLRARAQVGLAWVHIQTQGSQSHAHIRREVEPLVTVFEEAQDDRGAADALRLLGRLQFWSKQWEAAADLQNRALLHARKAGDERREADSIRQIGSLALWGPEHVDQALARCRAILGETSNRRVQANCIVRIGGLEGLAGRLDSAREAIARAREIMDDLGLRHLKAHSTDVAVLVEMLAGDYEAAEREARAAYAVLEEMGDRTYQRSEADLIAKALLAQGRTDDAEEWHAVGKRLNATVDDDPDDLTIEALIKAQLGLLDKAEELLRASLEQGGEKPVPTAVDPRFTLAEILARSGRPAEARMEGEACLRRYEAKGIVPLIEKARELLAQIPT